MTRPQSIYLDAGIERGGWNVRSVTEGSAMGDVKEENERQRVCPPSHHPSRSP